MAGCSHGENVHGERAFCVTVKQCTITSKSFQKCTADGNVMDRTAGLTGLSSVWFWFQPTSLMNLSLNLLTAFSLAKDNVENIHRKHKNKHWERSSFSCSCHLLFLAFLWQSGIQKDSDLSRFLLWIQSLFSQNPASACPASFSLWNRTYRTNKGLSKPD